MENIEKLRQISQTEQWRKRWDGDVVAAGRTLIARGLRNVDLYSQHSQKIIRPAHKGRADDLAGAVGFEPTVRLLTDQTISSRSRYGHFDTLPQFITTSALRKTERTDGENKGIQLSGTTLKTLETSRLLRRRLPNRPFDFES